MTTEPTNSKVEYASMYRRWIAQELRSARNLITPVTAYPITTYAAFLFGQALGSASGITIAHFDCESHTYEQMDAVRAMLNNRAGRSGL